MPHRLIICASILLTVILLGSNSFGQSSSFFNQRDDTYRLLGLKRAKQVYEAEKAELERTEQLFKEQMVSQVDLEQVRARFTDAEVNYQQSLLAVLFEQQYVTVAAAVKYQADDGSKHVKLTVANSSGGSAEFRKLIEMEDELFRSLQPDVVNNVYVSLLNDEGAIISQPYEAKIDMLRYGQPVDLDFALLQDLDAINVFLVYANGSQRNMKIWLQKDESVDRVLVQSEQFSQEVELGESALFDLTLELFSGTSNTFSLEVVNLTPKIGRFFQDGASSARLSQVKFTESARAKKAALSVTLPDRPDDEIRMDESIPFYVLVVPRDLTPRIEEHRDRDWTEEEIKALNVGYVKLELVPRGVGELRVTLPQLYHSIDPDSVAQMMLTVRNEGSHTIDNVEIEADLPLNWTHEITPDRLASLNIREEANMQLSLMPPAGIAPGKYEIRLRTSGISDGQPITADDKTITVEIKAETSVVATILIVSLLLAVAGGIVIFGLKLSRR